MGGGGAEALEEGEGGLGDVDGAVGFKVGGRAGEKGGTRVRELIVPERKGRTDR